MNVAQMVLAAVKQVFLALTPNRSLIEGLLKYDFKIENPRVNLMQISFSPLANWPLYCILFLIWLDPTRSVVSLQSVMTKIFGAESSVRFFLLDGQILKMATVLAIFFISEWILRKEYLLIAAIFYFLAQSEIHLNLALAAIIGVYLSRAVYLWWVSIDLQSQTRRIWLWVTSLQLLATVLSSLLSLFLLDQYSRLQYFSGSFSENRFLFLLSMVFFFQFFIFLFLAMWGHFSYQFKEEPSFLPVYFSSASWISRFKISLGMDQQLKEKVVKTLKHHSDSLVQLNEMKDQSPGLRLDELQETLNKELGHLQRAASRLTLD